MSYDDNNIFAKILRGELPSHRIYEDEAVVAFMDVMPQGTGHSLVVPKAPSRNLLDADPETLGPLFVVVQRAGIRPDRLSPACPRHSALRGRSAEAAYGRHGKAGGAGRQRRKDQGCAGVMTPARRHPRPARA